MLEFKDWFEAAKTAQALEAAIRAMGHHCNEEEEVEQVGILLARVRIEEAQLWKEKEAAEKKKITARVTAP